MKKTVTFILSIIILIALTFNVFAVVDFNNYPNQTGIMDGYSYCLWWDAYSNYFDIGIEISGYYPSINITMQSVIEYTDGSYDLDLTCNYDWQEFYFRAYKDLTINPNKELQSICFEFHIWNNNQYQTTICKDFFY